MFFYMKNVDSNSICCLILFSGSYDQFLCRSLVLLVKYARTTSRSSIFGSEWVKLPKNLHI